LATGAVAAALPSLCLDSESSQPKDPSIMKKPIIALAVALVFSASAAFAAPSSSGSPDVACDGGKKKKGEEKPAPDPEPSALCDGGKKKKGEEKPAPDPEPSFFH
jgi:hypothetical protein